MHQPLATLSEPIFLALDQRLKFCDLIDVIRADEVGQVIEALERVSAYVDGGNYAAGFLAYEAAPAFDPAFIVHSDDSFPCLWFGIYGQMVASPLANVEPFAGALPGDWRPLVAKSEYMTAFSAIKEQIRHGHTYQVNLTFPMEATIYTPADQLFNQLYYRQPVDYAAALDIGDYEIFSLSPELFWRTNGELLVSKPMKGTRPRGLTPDEDERLAAELSASHKERAENLMIVDMVRNDLGRIADMGTVQTADMFKLEPYATVWQMTSTIQARTTASLPRIMATQFPPASITGAPKIKTMEIINRLEPYPRQAYCGTIGWWGPGRKGCFNVAIRTLTRRKSDNRARYHVGGGITWDSNSEAEYAECMDKAALLLQKPGE